MDPMIVLFVFITVKPCSHVDKGVSFNQVKKGIKNAGGAAKLGQCQVRVARKTSKKLETKTDIYRNVMGLSSLDTVPVSGMYM